MFNEQLIVYCPVHRGGVALIAKKKKKKNGHPAVPRPYQRGAGGG